MRQLFMFQSLLGVSTVSFKNLNQSKVKTVYSLSWLIVQLISFVVFLTQLSNVSENSPDSLLVVLDFIITFHIIGKTVFDYKTQIASSMCIETAQKMLESENIKVRPLPAVRVMIPFLLLIWELCLYVGYGVVVLLRLKKGMRLLLFVTMIHYFLIHFVSTFTYYYFTLKISNISQTIDIWVEKSLKPEGFDEQEQVVGRRQKKTITGGESEANEHRTFKKVREIKGMLNSTKIEIQYYFWPFVVLFFIKFATKIPRQVYSMIAESASFSDGFDMRRLAAFFTFVSNGIYCLTLINAVENGAAESSEIADKLSASFANKKYSRNHKYLLHHYLANIHRSQPPNFWVFDLKYSLISDILDTSFLSFISMSGNK